MPLGIGRPPIKQQTEFGQRIAMARQNAGLTQTQLAEKLGTSQRVITYWERGTVALRAEQLAALANALNVSTDHLLGKDSKSRISGPTGKLRRLFEEASALPRSKQQRIIITLEDALAGVRAKAA